jgi:putative SOS response-associated peptidase YedK
MARRWREEEETDAHAAYDEPVRVRWRVGRLESDGGPEVTSFSIVTTAAAPSLSQYHSRMPVVLDDHQLDEWMRGSPDQAVTLLTAYPGMRLALRSAT